MAGLLLLLVLLRRLPLRRGHGERGGRRGGRGVRVEDGRRVDGGQRDLHRLLRHLRHRRELRQRGGGRGSRRVLQLQRDRDLALDGVQQDVSGGLCGGGRGVLLGAGDALL